MEITNNCPDCGEPLADDDSCPACGYSPARAAAKTIETTDHLDQAHIRRILADRKSIYRMRTVMLVFAFALLGAAAQALWKLALNWTILTTSGRMFYAGIALLGLLGFVFFFARARVYAREYRSSMQHDLPTAAPDFSNLGDGSQTVRNLEKIQ